MRTYRQFARDLSPAWLRNTWAGKLVSTIGLVFDASAESAFQAGAANLLGAPSFPVDALPYLGSERMIERYPGESDANYHARLKDAWNAWTHAGTPDSIVSQLAGLGLTAYIRENSPSASPSDFQWNWDGDFDNYSRFWVVITGHPWEPRLWNDGSPWGGGSLWGARLIPPATIDIRAVRHVIKKWKPAHTICPYAIVVFDMPTWVANQPDGTWGDPANRIRTITVGGVTSLVAIYVPVTR